ncbi:MAG TPA: hypothetical protein VF210_03695 [Pseudomonadales bacterium]
MSNITINDLSEDLQARELTETRGGIWDKSNRLGLLGEHLEARDKSPFEESGGMSIEDAANAGDDSMYYPGLRPLR